MHSSAETGGAGESPWQEMVRAAQAGSDGAVEALCERFAPLVRATAAKYRRLAYEDALQEGWMALFGCHPAFRRRPRRALSRLRRPAGAGRRTDGDAAAVATPRPPGVPARGRDGWR
ncbi:MAG: hypothetical protein IRZ33_10110 [Alicyclobacillaceae bacterium]|nr:hypothetical protein [Alicyclobacillaceae bacterium]